VCSADVCSTFDVQEAGIQPEARHANPLIFAEATNVSVHTAISGPLKEMQEGRLGVGCRPNADTYNAITQVQNAAKWAVLHQGTISSAMILD
jgi:hypothetical protein